jgi:hypothetical protein
MNSIRTLTAGLALTAFLSSALQADEITDQIDAARKSYESGELRASIQGLQFAVAGIQEKVNLALLQLLPEPLEGWNAEDAKATSAGMAAMIAGTNLTRHYFRDDGASVEISITADSPFLGMMTMMLSNPMMLQTDPGTRIYTHAGRRGMIKHDRDDTSVEISLMGNGNILIQVSGTGIDNETADSYLEAIDIDAVEKAFAQ